jgi:hypothetical protein
MRAAVVAAGLSFLLGCGGGGGQGAVDAGPPPVWLGVIGTGQSLSVGAASGNLLFTTPSAHDLKLSLGARATSWPIDRDRSRAVAGAAGRADPPARHGKQQTVSEQHLRRDVSHGEWGRSWGPSPGDRRHGPHVCPFRRGAGRLQRHVIQKNGTGNAYAASLFEATAFARLVAAAGARYEVGAVVLTHGERDAERATYEDDIARLGVRLRQDLRAVTGQTRAIPLIVSQQHPDPVIGRSTSTIAAWKAGVDYPGKISARVRSTSTATRAITSTWSPGKYDRLGIKYAEVFHEVVVRGERLAAVAADRRDP